MLGRGTAFSISQLIWKGRLLLVSVLKGGDFIFPLQQLSTLYNDFHETLFPEVSSNYNTKLSFILVSG